MAKTKDTVSHDGHRQRMKERLLRDGLESFSEHEMLELLLFYALPYRDTNALGHVLIDRFGSLCNVLDAAYADLLKVPGVTPHIATLLTLCGQTAHSYMRRRYQRGTLLYTAKELGEYILPWFIGQKAESVVLVSMDNRSKLLNATRIFEGSVNSAQFNFRTAVQQALQDNATRVVMAHNHPNGFALPSNADIDTTRRFAEVLALVDIRLVNHIVVAEDDYVSMAETPMFAEIFRTGSSPAKSRKVAEK